MKRELSEAAKTAKAIRLELGAVFPGVKFYVRSENSSGGNSVNVYWTDGPKTKEVEAVIDKYSAGYFDGMTDMYEYTAPRDGLPRAKFVFANREMSDKTRDRLRAEVGEKYGVDMTDDRAVFEIFHEWPDTVLYRAFAGELR